MNGVQAQISVGSGNISIDNINDEDNANLYADNPAAVDTYNTEMDGFTVTLTLKAPVTPGATNMIKLAIADSGDGDLDSNLLIAGGSVQTVLITGHDTASLKLGQSGDFDLLSNDSSTSSMDLMITQINGQPVSVGDVVSRFKAKTPQSILAKVLWEHTAPPLFRRCICRATNKLRIQRQSG